MVCNGSFDFQDVTHSWVGTQGSLYATDAAFSKFDRGFVGSFPTLDSPSFHGFSPKLLTVIPEVLAALLPSGCCCGSVVVGLPGVGTPVLNNVAKGPSAFVKRSSCC